jgi:broad specificity phosphatase PhoE
MTGERFQLFLVRHGLTDWNVERRLIGRLSISLNEEGRAQARAAAEALSSYPIRAIYSSPQLRTRETAAFIASALALEVQIDPAFDEVWLDEEWQGKTVEELRDDPEIARALSFPAERSPMLEPIDEVRERTVEAVERLRKELAGGSVVVVSHGDPLRAIVAHYIGLSLGSYRRLLIENGSMTLLRFNARGPQLRLLNWRPVSFATRE